MSLKVKIDPEICTGCGICYSDECPEVFEESGGGTQLREKYRTSGPYEGEVPDELEECVRRAMDSCPLEGISLE